MHVICRRRRRILPRQTKEPKTCHTEMRQDYSFLVIKFIVFLINISSITIYLRYFNQLIEWDIILKQLSLVFTITFYSQSATIVASYSCLDLSAAFDTVDHDILLGRLEHRFGITGKALSWLTSYLIDRTQFVKVANEHSTIRNLLCGVSQGSVLAPILYSIYTAPLADIIRQHGLNFHFYADDTQIYLSFNPKATGEPMHSLSRVQSCISDITNWMTSNKLMLNSDKTKLLVFNASHRPLPPLESITVGRDVIHSSHAAKNIYRGQGPVSRSSR